MSTDFKDAKKPFGATFPERAIDGTGLYAEIEPLLDGKLMQRRFLFGIPLISPMTKEKLGVEDLEDFVKRGMARFQMDSKALVQTKLLRHRLPFDVNLYKQYMALEIPYKPIRRVLRVAICSASYAGVLDKLGQPEANKEFPSGGELYKIPSEWIESGNQHRGLINVVPLGVLFSGASMGFDSQAAAVSGQALLMIIGAMGWLPAFWTVEAETGLMNEDGMVPVIVNEAIGSASAIYACDILLPLFRTASQSMSVDSLSQSVNDRMIELLQDKRNTLEVRYKEIIKQLKVMFGNAFFTSNI